jgi:type IV pilus assembly protein PilQ
MKRISTIIEQLDKATDQVMIESKFVEVTDRDIRNIGVNWASLQGMSLGVNGISQSFNKTSGQSSSNGVNTGNTTSNDRTNTTGNNVTNNTNSGVTSGNTVTYITNPASVNNANGAFANSTLNLPGGSTTGLPSTIPATTNVVGFTPFVAGTPAIPAVVNGSGIVTSPAVAAVPDTPASWTAPYTYSGSVTNSTTSATGNSVGGSTSNTISDTISNLVGLTNSGSTARVATAVFSASDFGVVISALKTQNNTKIVSNPTIVTLNNTEAFLNIGQEFPVPSYTYNSERGSFEVSGFTYKPIGIILKVTPQVNARGIIKMTLEPEVSQQNGSTSFGGAGGAQIPIIATRKAKTQVSLKDGYTMGIGGLITTSTDHGGNKVPILGDIPLLGRLFSSKNTNDVSTNLLIFITAKTVSADGASPEQVFDPRAIQAVGMTREDLPGNRAPKGTDLFPLAAPTEKKK